MTRAQVGTWLAVILLSAAGGATVAAIDRWPAAEPCVECPAPGEGPPLAPAPSSWAGYR